MKSVLIAVVFGVAANQAWASLPVFRVGAGSGGPAALNDAVAAGPIPARLG